MPNKCSIIKNNLTFALKLKKNLGYLPMYATSKLINIAHVQTLISVSFEIPLFYLNKNQFWLVHTFLKLEFSNFVLFTFLTSMHIVNRKIKISRKLILCVGIWNWFWLLNTNRHYISLLVLLCFHFDFCQDCGIFKIKFLFVI